MRDQDRAAIRRARNALTRAMSRAARQGDESFLDDGIRIAMRTEIDLLRAALRDFHMLEPPGNGCASPPTPPR